MISKNLAKELSEKIYYQTTILRLCCKHHEELENPQAISYLANCTCKTADTLYAKFLETEND